MQANSAILAKRIDDGAAETDEIRALAEAAGFEVVGEVTQSRAEDSTYQFGRGKAETLVERVRATGASTVVFDNSLSPQQTYELGELCPDGTEILDRYRLVLRIFAQQAGTKEAQLQVKLARLRYELPRVQAEIRLEKEVANERRARGGLGEKEDRRVTDIRDRIDRIRTKLDSVTDVADRRREERRERGFDLVAIAGYTNAGKSTLLRRLADDLDVGRERHDDLAESAAVEDRPFKTLETTTRRAEIWGRRTLVTDTVGFVRDLPHWLVESFETTFSEAYEADLVLLVADVSDPLPELREKLRASRELLDGDVERVVTVLNKADRVSNDEVDERVEAVSDLAPSPVVISATDGTGVDDLRDRIVDELPEWRVERLTLPNCDETMSLLSWLYDVGRVETVRYPDGGKVVVEFAGAPTIVERATARAETIGRAN